MENIVLNSGQTVIIGSNRDIAEAVGEHCSYALASLISAKMVDMSCLCNVLEVLEDLQVYIEDSKRINKNVIYQKISRVVEFIGNEL